MKGLDSRLKGEYGFCVYVSDACGWMVVKCPGCHRHIAFSSSHRSLSFELWRISSPYTCDEVTALCFCTVACADNTFIVFPQLKRPRNYKNMSQRQVSPSTPALSSYGQQKLEMYLQKFPALSFAFSLKDIEPAFAFHPNLCVCIIAGQSLSVYLSE